MIPSEFEKKIKEEKIAPLYLFLVEDSYSVNRLLNSIDENLRKNNPTYEKIRWDAADQSIDFLFSELQSFSFFSNYRLIAAHTVEKIKKENFQKIVEIQKNNSSSTLILLTSKKETFREISKLISNPSVVVECTKPKGKEIPSFLTQFARERGKSLGYSEARLLIDLIGEDLSTLYQQIQLLSLFIGEKEKIDSEDLLTLFSEIAEKNVFELTKSISKGDLTSTFRLSRRLLRQGEVPLKLFALLARHYRILLKAKLALKKGMSSREISQVLKLPPFVVEELITQAKVFNWKKLIQIYQELEETDLSLKSSSVPSPMIFEKMVWNVFK